MSSNEISIPVFEDWMLRIPKKLEDKFRILEKNRNKLVELTAEGERLRKIAKLAKNQYDELEQNIRENHPLCFVLPSYEQTLVLNSWIWGISFVCVFTANRIGKTAAIILNKLLWMFPNNPKWAMFQYREDHQNRPCMVFSRPTASNVRKIAQFFKQRPDLRGNPNVSPFEEDNPTKLQTCKKLEPTLFQPCYPFPPLKTGGRIWFGAPNNKKNREDFFPEWLRWIPKKCIKRSSITDLEITISTNYENNPKPTTWEWTAKTYEADDNSWASGAVNLIHLTEGPSRGVLNEVKNRFKEPAFGGWDFTPYEPTNNASASALAYQVFKGKEFLPLEPHVFTKFSVRNAPDYICPENKKIDLIRVWSGTSEGKARLDGEFYSDSPLILSHLDKNFHCLEWSKDELFDRFPTGQLFRGIDPGIDHPTACAWALLAPDNCWYVYRFYSKRQTSIAERCEDIVFYSNNKLYQTKHRLIECHVNSNSEIFNLTFLDYHTFKTDEVTKRNYALNYILNGLNVVESVHTRPQERAQHLNTLLQPNRFYSDPRTLKPPGAKIYFLINELGVAKAISLWEELYWQRFLQGPNKNLPKDELPSHNDDELDALCYIVCSPVKWSSFRPKPTLPPMDSQEKVIEQTFANLQNCEIKTQAQAQVFGSIDFLEEILK